LVELNIAYPIVGSNKIDSLLHDSVNNAVIGVSTLEQDISKVLGGVKRRCKARIASRDAVMPPFPPLSSLVPCDRIAVAPT
jgi:hypothetical protein